MGKRVINSGAGILFFIFAQILEFNSFLYGCEQTNLSKCVKTCFVPISQGSRLYAQYHTPINNIDCKMILQLEAMYFLQESMNSCEILKSLFQFNSLMFVGNSDFDDQYRPKNALVPEYFGLANDTNTALELFPSIRNQIFELQLSGSIKNLWFQVNLPIVWSNWRVNNGNIPDNAVGLSDLDFDNNSNPAILSNILSNSPYQLGETDEKGTVTKKDNTGIANVNTYLLQKVDTNEQFSQSQNFMGISYWGSATYENSEKDSFGNLSPQDLSLTNIAVPVANLASGSLTILQDGVYPALTLVDALNGYTFGDLNTRLYNLFNFGNNSFSNYIGIADIQLWGGFDFIHLKNLDAGVYIRAVVPTGTNINSVWGKYIFSPIIGNSGHFGFGLGANGQIYIFKNECSSIEAHIDGYFMHLFGNDQFRSFDLDGQPMSRYGIIKQLRYETIGLNSVSNNDPFSYLGLYALGDLNSKYINVTIDLFGEALIDLIYKNKNCSCGIGYSFSGQTKEKSCAESMVGNSSIENLLHGRLYYGYKGINELTTLVLNANQSVFASQIPLTPQNSSFFAKTNDNITIGGNSGAYLYGENTDGEISKSDLFTLPQINRSGLMEAQVLNRIFAHIEYSWKNSLYSPILRFIGAYGFVPKSYLTAKYWDVGIQFSCSF